MPSSPVVTAGAEIVRTEVRTRDREVAAETANGITPHRARITFEDPAAVDLRIVSATYGLLGADLIDFEGARYRASSEPLDFVVAGTLLDGGATVRGRHDEITVSRMDGFLYPLHEAYQTEFLNPTALGVRIPLPAVAALAEETTGLLAADLTFSGLAPVSDSMRRYWTDTVTFLCRQLTTPDIRLPPLLADQLLRLGASAVLSAFPNTSMTATRIPGAGRSAPAVVQRAREYIEANAELPLDVADIAVAAGVGTRAVQAAFRRHLDTTPMSYLRTVRLERVRRELRAADPMSGVTVAATARRWGFGNLSRFAGDYRTAFGELPNVTLRG